MISIDDRGGVTHIRYMDSQGPTVGGLPPPLHELVADSSSLCAFQAQDDTQH